MAATSVIELRCKCDGLKRADLFSKSDPFVVLYTRLTGHWHELGRTETVPNAHNAAFNKAFVVDYYFDEIQSLKAEVYDRDSESENLSEHDFLGCVEFTLGHVMGSVGHCVRLDLQERHQTHRTGERTRAKLGTIEFRAEEKATSADVLQLQFTGTKLDNKDGFFSKSDPFVNIYRSTEDGNWVRVWSSEVIKNNLNPVWKETKIKAQVLCNGDYLRPLKVECMDWEASSKHQLIGAFETSVHQWLEGNKREFDLINPERKKKKGARYRNSGTLSIARLQIYRIPTFVEFCT